MNEKFFIDLIKIILLLIITIIMTFYITKEIVRNNTINEIYNHIDVQFNACTKSCGILMPSWVNIRQGIAECVCLEITNNGKQINNTLSIGDN